MNLKIIKALILGVLITVFLPSLVNAVTTNCSWNSLSQSYECSSRPDLMDRFEQGQQMNAETDRLLDNLKQQYGLTKFYDCYWKSGYDKSNAADPYVKRSIYQYTQYCLESNALREEASNDLYEQIQCGNPDNYPDGATWFNGRCVTYDEGCQENYGPSSYYLRTDNNGKLVCGEKKADPPPAPSPDQICKQKYGPNSVYQNTNSEGQVVCDCSIGYDFNQDSTACVFSVVQGSPPQTSIAPPLPESNSQPNPKPGIQPEPNQPEVAGEQTETQEELKQTIEQEQDQPSLEPAQQEAQPEQQGKSRIARFFENIINFFKKIFKISRG